ncbi:MAG: hypothetical protein AAGE52_36485 [Myxococcota bacterium]
MGKIRREMAAGLVAVALMSCGGSSNLRFQGSASCGDTGRAVETWCGDRFCEFRVVPGGDVFRCEADGMPSCTDASAMAATACVEGPRVDAGADDAGGDRDAGTDSGAPICEDDERIVARDVDLLLMIDNSASMMEEQAAFAATLPHLIRALQSGDIDEDGTPEFPGAASIQVGVITSDLGTGAASVPTCDAGPRGDDGILQTEGCGRTFPDFLLFQDGDPGAFAADVGCLATTGTDGCGFERQLDAILKSVTPSSSATTFDGTSGHADGANTGFVRRDALLAIIALTDEEDCSASDTDLYNASSSVYVGDLNLRCFQFPEAVHPVSRYVNGLIEVKGAADRVVYAAIAGIPPGLEGQSWAAILADPDMAETVDPAMPTRLRPSCSSPRGLAFPPRRFVELGRNLDAAGGSASAHSICNADLRPAVDGFLTTLGARLQAGVCPR